MRLIQRNRKTYRILLWSLTIVMLLLLPLLLENMETEFITFGDYPQYWAAARLFIHHQNPYDPVLVYEIRNEAGQSLALSETPSMLLYPPWSLPLLVPFGLIPYPISRMAWLFLNTAVLLYCTHEIWRKYHGRGEDRWVANLILLAFFPNLYGLLLGHISPIFLLSAVLFLANVERKDQKPIHDYIAGASLAILTIKPTLLPLLFLAVLVWGIHRRRWTVFAGAAVAVVFLSGISLLFNPAVFNQYASTLRNFPLGAWATPTLGSILRVLFGVERTWLQFLPSLFAVIWFSDYWRKHKESWQWSERLPAVIFVSILTAPYGWTYDFSILLLPLLFVAVQLSREGKSRNRNRFIALFVLINLAVLVLHTRFTDFWFFWFVPALSLWYLFGTKFVTLDRGSEAEREPLSI